jgi:hypothetical protein
MKCDVSVRSGISVLLGEAKVHEVDKVGIFSDTNQYVGWLHILVDDVSSVYILKAGNLDGTYQFTRLRRNVLIQYLPTVLQLMPQY